MEPTRSPARSKPHGVRPAEFCRALSAVVAFGVLSACEQNSFVPPPPLFQTHGSLDLNTHLYVSLGKRIPDLQPALLAMSPRGKQNVNQQGGPADSWPGSCGWASTSRT